MPLRAAASLRRSPAIPGAGQVCDHPLPSADGGRQGERHQGGANDIECGRGSRQSWSPAEEQGTGRGDASDARDRAPSGQGSPRRRRAIRSKGCFPEYPCPQSGRRHRSSRISGLGVSCLFPGPEARAGGSARSGSGTWMESGGAGGRLAIAPARARGSGGRPQDEQGNAQSPAGDADRARPGRPPMYAKSGTPRWLLRRVQAGRGWPLTEAVIASHDLRRRNCTHFNQFSPYA